MSRTGSGKRLPDERGEVPIWLVPLFYALTGTFLALTAWNKCSNAESFPLESPAALPSHFCRPTHLYPGSPGSVSLVFLSYLIPAGMAFGGAVMYRKTQQRSIQWVGMGIGAVLLALEIWVGRGAHLGYHGV